MALSKTTGKKNDPPAPGSIELDIKSIEDYINIKEQGVHSPIHLDRPSINTKIHRIGNFGLMTNQTLKKTLNPTNQLAPAQPWSLALDELTPQSAIEQRIPAEDGDFRPKSQGNSSNVMRMTPEATHKTTHETTLETRPRTPITETMVSHKWRDGN